MRAVAANATLATLLGLLNTNVCQGPVHGVSCTMEDTERGFEAALLTSLARLTSGPVPMLGLWHQHEGIVSLRTSDPVATDGAVE